VHSSDLLLNALGGSGDEPFEVPRPAEWLTGRYGRVERGYAVDDASMVLRFSAPPVASALAAALLEIDREARRTATAIERRVPPEDLRGRGVRLVPLADGLVVHDAQPGSLNVLLLLGGIYSAVTSQPLSFALNVASLMGYGKLTVRGLLPDGRQRRKQGRVGPSRLRLRSGVYEEAFGPAVRIPTPHGDVIVPQDVEHLTLHLRGADGSEFDLEMRPG
jgi:hypothetical protein